MADEIIHNDNTTLKPVTEFDGPKMRFDFPGLEVGVAEYAEGPSGCTVFRFPRGSTSVADVRGGAPGTILSHREGWIDSICLSGGSIYGLEAATGVSAELLADRDYDTDWMNIAIVSGAVIYDFNQHRLSRSVYPDKALGRAAINAARPGVFPLGARGAGACATVGKWLKSPYTSERGGQGGAFLRSKNVNVAAFTVVNSVGAIVDKSGTVVRGHLDPGTGKRHRVGDVFDPAETDGTPPPPPGNTTLTVVVFNQSIGLRELRQLARQVHASMARAIDPFHTIHDGDVLYAVTTNQLESEALSYHELSYMASELAWDAVLSSF
jgi:L-aminopeptidase/D-esterase-like protein